MRTLAKCRSSVKALALLVASALATSAQAEITTVTYTGTEIAANWNVYDEPAYEGQTEGSLIANGWDTDGCTLNYSDSELALVSKSEYFHVTKVELSITPSANSRYKEIFEGVYVGSEQLLPNSEMYLLESGVTTDLEFYPDDASFLVGKISFNITSNTAGVKIESIKVTYDNSAGNRELAWSASETTGLLGEEFTAPTLSGETSNVVYSSSDQSVAVVDAEGVVSLVSEGTTIISAKCPEAYPWAAGEASYTLTVKLELTAEGTDETITLTEAGTLEEKVKELESVRVRSLTVVGPINGADLAYIHTAGTGRLTNLQAVDLKGVTLDPDGETVYASYGYNSDIGLGSVTYQYIMSAENRVEYSSTPTGLGGGNAVYKVYNDHLAGAFCNMPTLKKALLPDWLPLLGESTYYGCSELVEATVPSETVSIGERAFQGCSKLAEAVIPSTVKEIGDYAFSASAVVSASLGSVTKMGKSAFSYTKLMGCIDLSCLTDIPDNAFRGCAGITNVKWCESLDSIGEDAFSSISLTELSLPTSCRYIGPYAFYASQLQTIDLPENCLDINYSTFRETPWFQTEGEKELEIIYVGNVAIYATNYFTSTTLTLPEGTTAIANDFSFSSYNTKTAITKVVLPSTLRRIGDNAFSEIRSIASINWPENLEEMGYKAFSQCALIPSVTFGASMKRIGERAFYGCNALATVDIPENVEEVGTRAFAYCSGLVKVHYAASNATGSGLFYACTGLESITIGRNVRNIPDEFAAANVGYNGPSSLTKVEFEDMPQTSTRAAARSKAAEADNLTIGSYCFQDCASLSSFTIPAYTTSIGESVFSGAGLKSVMCYLSEPIDFSESDLYDNGKETTIYVGEDVLPLFQANSQWSQCTLQGVEIVSGIDELPLDGMGITISGGVVSVKGLADGTKAALYDTSGRMVGSAQGNTMSLNAPSGVYILRLSDAQGHTSAMKLMVK